MASKKIFDVLPPAESRLKSKKISQEPLLKIRPVFKFKFNPILLAPCLIILAALLGFMLIKPKAVITVFPKLESMSLKTESSFTGEIFNFEELASQEFSATGLKAKSTKAEGIIRVYNNYSSVAQPLIANTRFVSSEGKLFRTPERIIVPGSPGYIDIKVAADQPGEDYNIGPTSFSIPGFVGTPKYTLFYAKSFENMTGGKIEKVPEITYDDFENAKISLRNSAEEAVKISSGKIVAENEYIILEEALSYDLPESIFSQKILDEVEKFTGQAKIKAKALGIKKIDLENFARDFLIAKIPQGKTMQNSSFEILYFPKSVDFNKNKIKLDLKISANIYSTVDQDSLRGMAQNKKAGQIQDLLAALPEIERVQVKFSLFWVKVAPKQLERIIIQMGVD